MPAHVFARLGQWKPAQASCQKAWDVSVAWVARDKLSIDHQDFHSLSWLVEIGFERGRRKDADAAMTIYRDSVRAGLPHDKRAAYANQVTSYLARTGEWGKVEDWLAVLGEAKATDATGNSTMACDKHAPPSGVPTALFEQRAVLATRARAAAMQQDLAGVKKLLAERDAVDAKLRPFLEKTQPKELIESGDELRGFVRAALEARARGDDRALVAALAPLAKDQTTEFTGEGTAGGVLHREDRAGAMLRRKDAKGALAEYRGILVDHPGRARSLLGAARAARQAGDLVAMRDFYRQLLDVWSEADDATDGLAEARKGAVDP